MLRTIFALTCLLSANTAFAAVIDFSDSAFAAADGSGSYSTTVDGGVGVTLNALPTPSAELVHSSSGIGIDYYDWGAAEQQIEGSEVLSVTFDQEVTIDQLYISNLYDWGLLQIEVGEYTIDGDTAQFSANSSSGQLTVDVNAAPTTSISFRAQGGWSSWVDNGFTLGGISFNGGSGASAAVPELDPSASGSALALLLGGALMLRGGRRRQV